MKTGVSGGVARALVALGLLSYHAMPALAVGKTTTPAPQLQWVTQLIVKEKNSGLKTQSVAPGTPIARADVAAVQRWSVAAQLPVMYKRAMSGGAHVVTLPNGMSLADAQTVAQRMQASGQFEYVSPDRIMRPTSVPNDPKFTQQWSLWPSTVVANGPSTPSAGGANITTAWDSTKGAPSVNVAVIDTGLLTNHEDFVGANIRPGYDFISSDAYHGTPDPATNKTVPLGFVENDPLDTPAGRDTNPSDPGDWVSAQDTTNYPSYCGTAGTHSDSSWHGTFVTGQIVAQHNSVGIAGIAPNVTIQMARALGKCGGTTSDIIDALAWVTGASGVPGAGGTALAVNSPMAQVVNMSLGGAGACSSAEQAVITAARNRGATIVVATGNDGAPFIGSPANCNGVIAVTAHTIDGDNAFYANVGTGTTISAPGGGPGQVVTGTGDKIVSLSNASLTTPDTGTSYYTTEMGTSMATPHVAGVAALLLSHKPTLSVDDIKAILTQSARAFPAGTFCAQNPGACGAGMLDAGAAIALSVGTPTVTVSSSASTVVANNAVTLTAVVGAGFGNTLSGGGVQWAQTAGPGVTPTTAGPDSNGNYTATFTPSAAGTYSFTVTVTNNLGGTASASTSVTVTAPPTTTPGTGTGTLPFSGGTSGTGSLNQSGGGGALPLGLAALLFISGALTFRRRKS
ncbi:MprA protease, GlyGly-CTERM protein-sorting domain-containing form [Ralstonia pickettii]|uniref:MprA protease, GlyGly-CTERM protein-sorting domain-containing form n=1 Tax=Ralstonia pickettii TaxID=329 RepID=A0A2N4TPF2_RALPI|nr:MprA protease, GlyGly-CTERM protein-sorting domain-containing form [Ralstonia pickettii]PLC41529.1 MprA protease, GlyGly-CTERM protein-sorting domain-containing form [Ralstonia pickettii]